ncbi:MAG TPA: zf-HC2 domain-containing protein [Bryobacteraceae bacterium]|nr:zf-HC2 domain-containing protein [Bryobacteraceae bacterium]
MNCPLQTTESTEILIEFCAGTLPAGTAAELRRHIDVCPDCRAFTSAQQEVWRAMDDWEAKPVSASFDRRLYDRIAEEEKPRSWKQWLAGYAGWRPAMAAGVATAGVALMLFVGMPDETSSPVAAPVGVENSRVDSIEPEQVERTLEDLEMLNQLAASSTQDL